MYSLKLATLIREFVDAEVVEFYRDMRPSAKIMKDFSTAEGHGVQFARFDGEIHVEQRNGSLAVVTTDVYTGEPIETIVDMVVLSTGAEAQADQHEIGDSLVSAAARMDFSWKNTRNWLPWKPAPMGFSWPGRPGTQGYPRQRGPRRSRSLGCPNPAGPRDGGTGALYRIH